MTSNQFFIRRVDPKTSRAFLEGDEHHHIARVARIKTGDEVWLFDDSGKRYLALVEDVEKERTRLHIIRTVEAIKPSIEISLGQASIKPKNMDLIVQKSAEIGIVAFIPLITARSLPGRESEGIKKIERWRKIAREAAKQSLRSETPVIESFQSLEEFARKKKTGLRFFLNENGGTCLRDILAAGPAEKGEASAVDVDLLIGPEGGWTGDEEQMLICRGFRAVSLGKTILRAETAAILAVGMIAHFWNT